MGGKGREGGRKRRKAGVKEGRKVGESGREGEREREEIKI